MMTEVYYLELGAPPLVKFKQDTNVLEQEHRRFALLFVVMEFRLEQKHVMMETN